MHGLHRRVIIALAMAWTATAAAQISPPHLQEPGASLAEDYRLLNRNRAPALTAAYLKPLKIHVPGAKFVKLHFSEFNLPHGMAVEISNPEGTETWRYTESVRDAFTINPGMGDDGETAFSAMSVSGDTAIVRYTGHTALFDPARHAVAIDTWTPEQFEESVKTKKIGSSPGLETTCGESERYDAICWVDDHPDEYERSTPVALVITATGKQCSAWRVGRQNRLFTARHCIGSQSTLEGAEIWFNFEASFCGGAETAQVVKVTGDELLTSDYHLDYTLFSVNDFEKISGFGNLGLDPRDGELGEEIFIPQHGLGDPKQIAIESDMNVSGLCEIDDTSVNSFIEGSDIGYFCDTVSSSSGAPVISSLTGKAIALHHNGGCLNSGTKVSMIWPQVKDFFDGVVPEGDADGNWAEANEPPVARFSETCKGLDCRFEAVDSIDSDGTITRFEWTLGDGSSMDGDRVEHTYAEPGDYEIVLTAVDDQGASDSLTQVVSVSLPNQNPVANFSTQCVENRCKFNGGSSSDSDGSIVSFDWNLGDGNVASGSTVEHSYKESGDYTVELTVEDDGQAKDSSRFTVSVNKPNQAPVPRFDIQCNDLDCTANAAGSSDADGEITRYDWQLGNGQSASGVSPRFSYEGSGDYTVRLTVTDDGGEKATIQRLVSVQSKNMPPNADFSGSCEKNVCTFDAGASSDNDGHIASYVWNIGYSTRYGSTLDVTFQEEGPQKVRLTVTDERGAEDSIEKIFNITLPSDPVARFTVSCTDLECSLDAGSSTASEGTITRYDWSFGDGETGTGGNVTHEYKEDGRYTVTLKITDTAKANKTSSQTVEVEAKAKKNIQLETSLVSQAKRSFARLDWTGVDNGQLTILRNGRQLATVSNINEFTDRSLKGLYGSVSYKVCEAASGRCSNITKLRLGK